MQSTSDLFAQYLAKENINIPIETLIINVLLAIVLSLFLEYTYVKCANTISNRRMFAKNFILLTLTTLLIISVVKSSLALSLGLVGALSIIRFRSAIKEPEELAYLFISISVGLGLGANQVAITVVGFLLIVASVWAKFFISRKQDYQNLYLTVTSNKTKAFDLEKVVKVLEKNTTSLDLRRYDVDKGVIELAFVIELDKTNDLEKAKKELQRIDKNLKMTFIDNKQII